jgi:hypothetical protein
LLSAPAVAVQAEAVPAGVASAVAAAPHRPVPPDTTLARAPGLTRVETPVTPAVPVPGVTESYVQLYDPLPASDGSVPPACNWIGYLRLRSTAGPANPQNADAVMTLMPGDEAGAALYVNQARLIVQEAAAQGKHVEVWIINRRSNCLVDTAGLQAAAAAHNWQVAIDYYYHGATIDGHTFAVFNPQTLLSIQATGIQAFYHPTQVSNLAAVIPASLSASLQFFLSQNALADATGNPPATGYKLTNQALLATFLDASTEPIGAFQAGLGTYNGPVIEKDFPATSPTQMMPANQTQAYPWIPYNKIATAPVQLNSDGQPFFDPREEVSDINTVAEVLTRPARHLHRALLPHPAAYRRGLHDPRQPGRRPVSPEVRRARQAPGGDHPGR